MEAALLQIQVLRKSGSRGDDLLPLRQAYKHMLWMRLCMTHSGANAVGETEGGEKMDSESGSKRRRGIGADQAADPSATLEANVENLNVKKFDLTFAVDPLFHKTSAQFDEGGAKGWTAEPFVTGLSIQETLCSAHYAGQCLTVYLQLVTAAVHVMLELEDSCQA